MLWVEQEAAEAEAAEASAEAEAAVALAAEAEVFPEAAEVSPVADAVQAEDLAEEGPARAVGDSDLLWVPLPDRRCHLDCSLFPGRRLFHRRHHRRSVLHPDRPEGQGAVAAAAVALLWSSV